MTTVRVGDLPEATLPPDSTSPSSQRSLASQIAGVAGHLERMQSNRQRGALAELRRLRPNTIPGAAFWEIVQRFDIPSHQESFWQVVLPLMVRHPHQRGIKPGRAIEAAGISKPRFERWLRLDRDGSHREAGRLLSRLDGQGFDWVELGYILYRWGDDERYRLARDFFLARDRREPTHNDGAE